MRLHRDRLAERFERFVHPAHSRERLSQQEVAPRALPLPARRAARFSRGPRQRRLSRCARPHARIRPSSSSGASLSAISRAARAVIEPSPEAERPAELEMDHERGRRRGGRLLQLLDRAPRVALNERDVSRTEFAAQDAIGLRPGKSFFRRWRARRGRRAPGDTGPPPRSPALPDV